MRDGGGGEGSVEVEGRWWRLRCFEVKMVKIYSGTKCVRERMGNSAGHNCTLDKQTEGRARKQAMEEMAY